MSVSFQKNPFGFAPPWSIVSLGREGPSVQTSGALASDLAGLAGVSRHHRRDEPT